MRANFVMSGVATGVRRNLTMTIALILSTSIALAFVGAAYLASTEISRFKKNYEGRLNASIFLCTSNSDNCQGRTSAQDKAADKAALDAELSRDPMVLSHTYVSEAEQVKRYDATSTPAVAKLTKPGDLPASFTVKLKDIKGDFDKFVAKYKDKPGVSGTTNASNVLKTLLKIIDGARLFSIMIAIVVLIASILLIANTIQVAAAQRKNETSIMGGLISLALITVGKEFVLNGIFKSPVDNGVIPDLTTNDILVAGGLGIIAGIVLAAATAFATLRLYVRL
jgi:cell division transport system permease protein